MDASHAGESKEAMQALAKRLGGCSKLARTAGLARCARSRARIVIVRARGGELVRALSRAGRVTRVRFLGRCVPVVLGALLVLVWASSVGAATTTVDAVAQARIVIQGSFSSFAAIPNLTGDGRPGLAISTSNDALGRPVAGVVHVLFDTSRTGTVSLADPTLHGFEIFGARPYDNAGFNITSAGDVNGDGRGDILLTAPRNGIECAGADTGPCGNAPHYAYVVYGKADEDPVDLAHLRRSQGFMIKGVAAGGLIAGLGRFAGARYGAIAVQGRVSYVIYGGRDPSNVDLAHLGSRGFRITAGGPGAGPPGVASAGDVNGDGRPDLLLYKGFIRSAHDQGVFVLFGRRYSRTVSVYHLGRNGFAIRGADIGVGVGDVNGDRRGDLLVRRAGVGLNYDVVYGSTASRVVDLAALGSRGFGLRYGPVPAGLTVQLNVLAGLGDLNGDGRADFGIATETYPGGNGPFQGMDSVVYGSRRSSTLSLQELGAAGYQLTTAVPPATCPATPGGNELGHELTALGNFSGDGQPEFAVGAHGLGPVPPGASTCSLPEGEVLIETAPSP